MPTHSFARTARAHALDLSPFALEVLQANVTDVCNQACAHCHISASPRGVRMMDEATVEMCLDVLARNEAITTLDLTGGAPELHPRFEHFVEGARALGKRVMVRHNLTVTLDPHPLTGESMRHLPALFAEHGVEVVASLPCYLRTNTDAQRGSGVFDKSIESLRLLNAQGFGMPDSHLVLDIVHNPLGAQLPGSQRALEDAYRTALAAEYGVAFTRLFVLANMPVNRFAEQLDRTGGRAHYVEDLTSAYNPCAAEHVMCRRQVSVGPDGTLYDCDFNLALGMAIGAERPLSIFDFDDRGLLSREIRFGEHCFGCAAGSGSSCCGATA